MAWKHKPEEIIGKLRKPEIAIARKTGTDCQTEAEAAGCTEGFFL